MLHILVKCPVLGPYGRVPHGVTQLAKIGSSRLCRRISIASFFADTMMDRPHSMLVDLEAADVHGCYQLRSLRQTNLFLALHAFVINCINARISFVNSRMKLYKLCVPKPPSGHFRLGLGLQIRRL